jgi:hypothetical protein
MIQEFESRPAFMKPSFEVDELIDWEDPGMEPSLDEILADPIVHLVLDRDHLEVRDVERFLKCASQRLYERDRSPNFGRVKLHCANGASFVGA